MTTKIQPKRCDKCGHVLGSSQRPLTAKQAAVLRFVCAVLAREGATPSFSAIAEHFGWRSLGTVALYIDTLEAKGYIRRDPRAAHGITVLVSFDEVGTIPVETTRG